MHFKQTILSFLLLSVLLLSGCKTKKMVQQDGAVKPKASNYLVKKVESSTEKYKTLSADLQLDGKFEGQRQRLRGKLSHVRDSVIWIKLTKFGFEVGRVMITPDSLFMINRINREYLSEPISYIESISGLPASFDFIQDLLVGFVKFEKKQPVESGVYEDQHFVKGKSSYLGIMLESYLNSMDYSFEKLVYTDYMDRKLQIEYLEDDKETTLMCNRHFCTYQTGDSELDLKCYFDKIEKDKPVVTSFQIPRKYDRI